MFTFKKGRRGLYFIFCYFYMTDRLQLRIKLKTGTTASRFEWPKVKKSRTHYRNIHLEIVYPLAKFSEEPKRTRNYFRSSTLSKAKFAGYIMSYEGSSGPRSSCIFLSFYSPYNVDENDSNHFVNSFDYL